jgi:hypothetical protein
MKPAKPKKENMTAKEPHSIVTEKNCSALVLSSVAIAILSFLLRVIVDSDTFWQIAIGRDIIKRFQVPRIDHYAAAAFGRPYHDSHWLFQVVVALADMLGGMVGVGLASTALWGLTFLFCYKAVRRWTSPAVASLLLFLVCIACSDRFLPRPEVVTLLMITVFYYLLQERRYTTMRHVAVFALLQVVWANSHGLFVIGPVLGFCYLSCAFIKNDPKSKADRTALLRLVATLVAATLITPFGPDGWRYALLLAQEAGSNSSALFQGLLELAPTFGGVARSFPDFWCYATLVVLVAATLIPTALKRQLSWSRSVIVLLLFGLSLTGRRNMPLFALAAAPIIAENLQTLRGVISFPYPARIAMAGLFLATSILPISGVYYRTFNLPLHFGVGVAKEAYSTNLPDYLHKIGFTGVIYSPPYLGGYSLYHGFKPTVDGRWEVYDPATLNRVLSARFNAGDWEWVMNTFTIQGVMVGFGEYDTEPLLHKLSGDKRFQNVYSDEAVSFWLRIK